MSRRAFLPFRPAVLFRVACGARRGFGHLVRALRLAEGLGVEPCVSIRGSQRACLAAAGLGAHLVPTSIREALEVRWDAVVVDDPAESAAAPWIAATKRLGGALVSVHDLGLGADGADLVVDGSVAPGGRDWPGGGRVLLGPAFAVVDPELRRPPPRIPRKTSIPSVLVALGGGPRARVAAKIGRAIARHRPDVQVTIAGGMMSAHVGRPHGLDWLSGPSAFALALQGATAVVSGGGVTLYECAAASVPAVAVAVVPAQRPTVEGFLRGGAVRDGGDVQRAQLDPDRLAREVCALLDDPAARRTLARNGRALVDGRGLERVCNAILGLIAERRGARRTRAAGASR